MQARLAFGRMERVALVERMVQARIARDFVGFADCFAAGALFWVVGSSAYTPFAGPRVGHAGLIECMRFFEAELRPSDTVLFPLIVDGDQAALRWNMMIAVRGGSHTALAKCLAHIKFAGPQISELTCFCDSAMVIELARRN